MHIKSLVKFNGRRWWAFGLMVVGVYFFAFFGPWVGVMIPVIGPVFFIVGLMIWFIPGLAFGWTPFFQFHEFGAAPSGWEGHVIMLAFYVCAAFLLSWPFGLQRRR